MKEHVVVYLNFKTADWKAARKFLTAVGRTDLAKAPQKPFGYTFEFAVASEADKFLDAVRKLAPFVKPLVRRRQEFSTDELTRAPLLRVGIAAQADARGGPQHGTEYDLSHACQHCGTGAIQTSALILDERQLPEDALVFTTLDGDVLVARPVYDAIARLNPTGANFREAVSLDMKPLGFFQILPSYELPAMSTESRGILREEPCPACGRDGYFASANEPMSLLYASVDPSAVPDFARTREYFGNSGIKRRFAESHFAHPLLIVKPRVYEAITECQVQGVAFTPVRCGSA